MKKAKKGKSQSSWRSVRVPQGRGPEGQLQRELRQRHSLKLHGICIGFVTLGMMWAVSHLQMVMGVDSLALRYLITLGAGYLAYLGILRGWAAMLLERRAESGAPDGGWGDLVDVPGNLPSGGGGGLRLPPIRSGHGGDFGGGGATGDFSGAADAGSALGDVAGGAVDALGGSDEGAVVVIPVIAVFLIGAAILFGAGSLLLLFFGWEVLLTVAVELAFSYVSARAAVRVAREGWISAAVRLTWKPMLGALACAVVLGATIDHFIPAANSLPQAVKLIGYQMRG